MSVLPLNVFVFWLFLFDLPLLRHGGDCSRLCMIYYRVDFREGCCLSFMLEYFNSQITSTCTVESGAIFSFKNVMLKVQESTLVYYHLKGSESSSLTGHAFFTFTVYTIVSQTLLLMDAFWL
jgi:hypothetical protein